MDNIKARALLKQPRAWHAEWRFRMQDKYTSKPDPDGLSPQQRYDKFKRRDHNALNREKINARLRARDHERRVTDPEYLERKRQQARDLQKKRRELRKQIIREARDKPCIDCGVRLPPTVMDLDHVRGEKLFQVCGNRANRYVSLDQLKDEIAKCDVRCPNCHRMRHWRERTEVEPTTEDFRDA